MLGWLSSRKIKHFLRKKRDYKNFDTSKFCSWCFGVTEGGNLYHTEDCHRPEYDPIREQFDDSDFADFDGFFLGNDPWWDTCGDG